MDVAVLIAIGVERGQNRIVGPWTHAGRLSGTDNCLLTPGGRVPSVLGGRQRGGPCMAGGVHAPLRAEINVLGCMGTVSCPPMWYLAGQARRTDPVTRTKETICGEQFMH